ncbi:uncharacterized protein [Nicotiana tomentosiformis]|uniref:uncharacterized protein n=1 Tax=Nicotiana tomentosiformis TaxID=4098 RepID=UPI00388CB563
MVGEKDVLKVLLMMEIIRFGKNDKLSPKFIGPFEVMQRVGDVAYEFSLSPSLSRVHPVFHVFMLWRYHDDRSHILYYSTVQLDKSLGYEEELVAIIDRQVRQSRPKKIVVMKVEWRGQPVEEATWEAEEDMRRRYPHHFSTPVPLTELLKKFMPWDWGPRRAEAFNALKMAISSSPVLALPKLAKPFEVQTNVSDYALGGVLLQEEHPMAYESRKLKDAERRYAAHEKDYCLSSTAYAFGGTIYWESRS